MQTQSSREGTTILVTYFRSSSFNSWDFCGHSYFLTYNLGLRPDGKKEGGNGWTIPKPQMKADKGNIVHKALELLARKKLATQQGKASFAEDEIGKVWPCDGFDVDLAFEEAWAYYTKVRCPHWPWDDKEYRLCRGWTYDVCELNGGMWNPLNRTVVQPEQYFDIPIEQPWAKYSYRLPDGTKLDGRLAIKGTVDLITETPCGTLEYLDWKTGQRKDWATGKVKDWKKLRDDPQLRIYHYALSKLYPDRKYIIMTIVFVQDGGAFSLDFGPSDLAKTEAMLKDRFEKVRDCQRPARILHQPADKWKCKYLCAFGMNQWAGTGKTVCQHMHDEVLSLGLDRVTAKYANGAAWGNYGEGGGRTAKEGK